MLASARLRSQPGSCRSAGLAGGAAVDEGLAAAADGLEEVLHLGAMGIAPGGTLFGVGLTAGGFILDAGGAALGDGDGVGGGFLGGVGLAVLQAQHLQAVAFDDGGAFGAEDVEEDLRVARAAGERDPGRLQHADGRLAELGADPVAGDQGDGVGHCGWCSDARRSQRRR